VKSTFSSYMIHIYITQIASIFLHSRGYRSATTECQHTPQGLCYTTILNFCNHICACEEHIQFLNDTFIIYTQIAPIFNHSTAYPSATTQCRHTLQGLYYTSILEFYNHKCVREEHIQFLYDTYIHLLKSHRFSTIHQPTALQLHSVNAHHEVFVLLQS
jgi:hypothetical protein